MEKSIETNKELEKKKLEIEIEILQHELKKIEKDDKHIGEKIRKNIALVLAVVSVIGGFLGVIFPLNKFVQEKRKEMIPTLNDQIISILDKNEHISYEKQEEALVMLKYYRLNAIPILLTRMKNAQKNDEVEITKNIVAIWEIYNYNDNGVLKEINSSLKTFFFENYQKTSIEEIPYWILDRYIQLYENLDLTRRERRGLEVLMMFFEEKIPSIKNDEWNKRLTKDLNTICNNYSIDSLTIAQ